MTVHKRYKITKRIKLHKSPLYEAEVVKCGHFLKETPCSYIFDDFRVNKSTVVNIEELECEQNVI